MNEFIKWLNKELCRLGWSNNELARRAGLSSGAVSFVMSQRQKPTFEFCRSVAQALQLPIETVLHKAGLLSPYPAEDDSSPAVLVNEVTDILRYLSIEDRRLIYEMAKCYYHHHHHRVYEKRNHNTDVNTPGHKPNPAMS